MTVGALLDLGADQDVLRSALDSLHLEGAGIEISRVKKSALDACDFNVVLDAEHENHDHDMAYLHPDLSLSENVQLPDSLSHEHHHETDHHHDHEHHHETDHHHDHEHHHETDHHHDHEHHHEADHHHNHDHGHHHHHGRNLADIEEILRSGNLTDRALELALKTFRIVADAESRVHGEPLEKVHFHEVGAVDSILDIAAVAVCMDNLGITDVVVTDLSEGTGTVMCQHGLLPVPVPATAQILCTYQIPFRVLGNVRGELITPTGAAILAALGAGSRMPDMFRILRTGLGAGKREYATAGVLRAMLIEAEPGMDYDGDIGPDIHSDNDIDGHFAIDHSGRGNTVKSGTGIATGAGIADRDSIVKLETNIDDCTGEALGEVMGILMEAGAKDVYYTSAYMKKQRPAYVLNVLCAAEDCGRLEEIIFRNTTTIGIREIVCARTVLPRRILSVETPWGEVKVKECQIGDDRVAYPEAESVGRLSREQGIGFPEMYHRIKAFLN